MQPEPVADKDRPDHGKLKVGDSYGYFAVLGEHALVVGAAKEDDLRPERGGSLGAAHMRHLAIRVQLTPAGSRDVKAPQVTQHRAFLRGAGIEVERIAHGRQGVQAPAEHGAVLFS